MTNDNGKITKMNKLNTTAVMLVALVAPAAAEQVPTKFIGNWCLIVGDEYQRSDCAGRSKGDWIRVHRDGYDAFKVTCGVDRGASDRKGNYLVKFSCVAGDDAWTQNFWMSLVGKHYFLSTTEREP